MLSASERMSLVSHLAVTALGAAVTAAIARWSATEARHHVGPRLRLSSMVLLLAIVGLVLSSAVLVGTVTSSRSSAIGFRVLSGAMFVPFVVLLVEYSVVRLDVSDEGVDYRLLEGRGWFRWDEVTLVRYVPGGAWFSVDLASGAVVRVPTLLVGLPQFARRVLDLATSADIDDATRARLRRCVRDGDRASELRAVREEASPHGDA